MVGLGEVGELQLGKSNQIPQLHLAALVAVLVGHLARDTLGEVAVLNLSENIALLDLAVCTIDIGALAAEVVLPKGVSLDVLNLERNLLLLIVEHTRPKNVESLLLGIEALVARLVVGRWQLHLSLTEGSSTEADICVGRNGGALHRIESLCLNIVNRNTVNGCCDNSASVIAKHEEHKLAILHLLVVGCGCVLCITGDTVHHKSVTLQERVERTTEVSLGKLDCSVSLGSNLLSRASVEGLATYACVLNGGVGNVDCSGDSSHQRKQRRAPRLKLGNLGIPLILFKSTVTILGCTRCASVKILSGSLVARCQTTRGVISGTLTCS